jgi:hypothetical protein
VDVLGGPASSGWKLEDSTDFLPINIRVILVQSAKVPLVVGKELWAESSSELGSVLEPALVFFLVGEVQPGLVNEVFLRELAVRQEWVVTVQIASVLHVIVDVVAA